MKMVCKICGGEPTDIEVEYLRREIFDCQKEMSHLYTEMMLYKGHWDNSKKQVAALRKTVKQTQEQRDTAFSNLKIYTKKTDELRKKLKSLQEAHDYLEQNNKDLTSDNMVLRKKLKNFEDDFLDECSEVLTQNTGDMKASAEAIRKKTYHPKRK